MTGNVLHARTRHVLTIGAAAVTLSLSATVWAQPAGTYRWQMQPYCNVLTVQVTQSGGVYALDGFDDQCGTESTAPLTGTAALNPDGSLELGVNIVTSPGAAPAHVAVALNAATLGGTWQDNAGNGGNFVFTPGAGTGGQRRPASAAVAGAIEVNPGQVQLRVTGTCAGGQLMQRINTDGSVSCAVVSVGGGDITAITTSPGSGLRGGADLGVADLRLATTATGAYDFSNPAGFAAGGTLGSVGTAPAAGQGARMMWYPAKGAFRVGYAQGSEWDAENIGLHSMAMGGEVLASGTSAIALGRSTFATADRAVAIGSFISADARDSLALGSSMYARPNDVGAILIADGAPLGPLVSSAANQFSARAAGGFRWLTSFQLGAGVTLAPGGSAWAPLSDVNAKENFSELDGEEVLARIARLPIREWNYKTQNAALRHAGPTAQDFYAAFGLGEDPLRISTIDADGIALRAIQALASRAWDHQARLRRLEHELASRR